MKQLTISIILMAIFGTISLGQVGVDPIAQKFTYKTVVTGPLIGIEGLYKASLNWFSLHYFPENAIVEEKDSAHHYFRSLCNFRDTFKFNEPHASYEPNVYYALLTTDVYYTLEMQVKEGKCIITISGLHFKYYIPGSSMANHSDTGRTIENTFENQYRDIVIKADASVDQKKSWQAFFKSCDRRLNALIRSYKKYISTSASDNGNAF